MISERPAEVEDRAVPGHWEGDRPNGTPANRDRHPGGTSHPVCDAVPPPRGEHRRSSPQPAGRHRAAAPSTPLGPSPGIRARKWLNTPNSPSTPENWQVYFCDPKSPWQRGTNENTNGLLRQYFPKGTDMSRLTQTDLDKAAHSLNGRPRQTLNGMTPSEKLAEVLQ